MNKETRVFKIDDIRILKKGVYPKVVNYTASWCGPCKTISPEIDKLSIKFKGIHFFKVDIDEHREHAEEMGISSVPTFMFYKDILSEPIIVKGANLDKIKKVLVDLKND